MKKTDAGSPKQIARKTALALTVTGLVFSSPILTPTLTTAVAQERKLDAHEHGKSTLKIAQEGNVISFELEAPGVDIVGFEREPANEDESKSIQDAISILAAADKIFPTAAAADCSFALDEAEYETKSDHAGFHVKWSITCGNVSEARVMTNNFFASFPKAEEIEVEAIGAAGQASIELTGDSKTLDLSAVIGE